MDDRVVIVADAGKGAGLGHVARSSAIAVALRCREIEPRCYGYGAVEPFRFDGIDWIGLSEHALPAFTEEVVVLDSYRIPTELVSGIGENHRLVALHDQGTPPPGAALVVSVGGPSRDDPHWAGGLSYAALRPGYWGLPQRALSDRVERILVTTGSGFSDAGSAIAQAIATTLPDTTVRLVVGPHAGVVTPPDLETLVSPTSLLEPLLDADVVVSSAGQSALEAVAAGTPCIALPLVDNQLAQAERLASAGAVRLVDPPEPADVAAACLNLARDRGARHELSRNGQSAVDGYGALRVAFAITRLAEQ
jgi:spore coat polysaccharide biosynthesis predicted glycosyltransferase SpsG